MKLKFTAILFLMPYVCLGAGPDSLARMGVPAPAATEAPEPIMKPLAIKRPLAGLLKSDPVTSASLDGFYEEIPPNLDKAVRYYGEENYTSATAILVEQLALAKNAKEKARVLMWLGLSAGQNAIDNPDLGRTVGTSSTLYLQQAIKLDPKVWEASEVARTLAEMAGHGWMPRTPDFPTTLTAAEQKAASTGKALDHFYAGVMLRRETATMWIHGDTTDLDNRGYIQLQRAVELDPERYEFWAHYLPSMMPIGFHDLMSTETEKVYRHFKALRNPLMNDMGPAALYLRTRSGYTMADDDSFLHNLVKTRPGEPFPSFQLALWAIETTPSLAVERFTQFMKDLEAAKIKLLPREAGYRPSALYKLAFLMEQDKGITETLALYERLHEFAPTYAEVKGNIAVICMKMAEDTTTGPAKRKLLEKAAKFAGEQEKLNYRGKAARKAGMVKQRVLEMIREVDKELNKPVSIELRSPRRRLSA